MGHAQDMTTGVSLALPGRLGESENGLVLPFDGGFGRRCAFLGEEGSTAGERLLAVAQRGHLADGRDDFPLVDRFGPGVGGACIERRVADIVEKQKQ